MPFPAAFFTYFPQFTPDELNDRAWYPGFTDWDLIRKMPDAVAPRFRPADGMYDTADPAYLKRLTEQTRSLRGTQVGLMVYHYHFDGVAVLRGFENNLLAAEETPPFFICWANETWSKRWVGKAGEIIIRQQHLLDANSIAAHARHLAALFSRKEYLRIDGRPVWMIYNPLAAPTLGKSIELYRRSFQELGFEPLIGCCIAHVVDPAFIEPFDFIAEFQPRFYFGSLTNDPLIRFASKLKAYYPSLVELIGGLRDRMRPKSTDDGYSYKDYLRQTLNRKMDDKLRSVASDRPVMRGAFYSWDNSPRYGNRRSVVHHNGVTADDLKALSGLSSDPGYPLLINSWNEWSEGAALEPAELPDSLRDAFLDQILRLR